MMEKNYQLIHANGEFEASIQYFYGITPYALYKLRTIEGAKEYLEVYLRMLELSN